jgi:hypothetical protein
MKNEEFKIINERWDRYLKEEPEPLDESVYDILDFINNLISSGKIAELKAMWDLVSMIGGFVLPKVAAAMSIPLAGVVLLTPFFISMQKKGNDKAMIKDLDGEFEKLRQAHPDKEENINKAHTTVRHSYAYIMKKSLFAVNGKKLEKELSQEVDPTSEGMAEKIQELILKKLNLEFFSENAVGGINAFIAGNFADPKLRKALIEFIIGYAGTNIGKHLQDKTNYDPATGALRFKAPPPTKGPEGREETPGGLTLPSGDDVKKFG